MFKSPFLAASIAGVGLVEQPAAHVQKPWEKDIPDLVA